VTSSTGATMTRADFERHLIGLRAWLNDYASYEETMTTFLVKLMEAQSLWSDEAILEVLRGDHGKDLQDEALLTVQGGFRSETSSYQRSFVSVCVHNDRIDLLRSVADMGMPPGLQMLDGCGASATNTAGQWLDTLASSDKRVFGGDGPRDFPTRVNDFSTSPAAAALADILVKHDPRHRAINRMHGSAGHGIIMEALMRSSIPETPAAATAPDRSRRRRAAL
jgi:hypothetical protein